MLHLFFFTNFEIEGMNQMEDLRRGEIPTVNKCVRACMMWREGKGARSAVHERPRFI